MTWAISKPRDAWMRQAKDAWAALATTHGIDRRDTQWIVLT